MDKACRLRKTRKKMYASAKEVGSSVAHDGNLATDLEKTHRAASKFHK